MDRYSDPKSFFEVMARNKLGPKAGSMHSFLVHQHIYLHQCWAEVEVLFDSTEKEQALLQQYINVFCRRASDAIWSQTIIGIAAMTEGVGKRNSKQATVPALLTMIADMWDSSMAEQKLKELTLKVANLTRMRHKFIAHFEAKWQTQRANVFLTREEINACLTGIKELLDLISDHWQLPLGPYLMQASEAGGARDLLDIVTRYDGARESLRRFNEQNARASAS